MAFSTALHASMTRLAWPFRTPCMRTTLPASHQGAAVQLWLKSIVSNHGVRVYTTSVVSDHGVCVYTTSIGSNHSVCVESTLLTPQAAHPPAAE
eukprot:357776-Chlamydomonas_euryale.AAC.1